MPTLNNGYEVDIVKKRYYRRSNMNKRKSVLPRKETECIKYIGNFLNRDKDKYKSKFRIIKDTDEHFVPEIGQCKISDAVIYDVYTVNYQDKFRRVISLEFEEHRAQYSILKNANRCPGINVPSRKLYYYRPFDAQYWIKIDVDGTPICIPYRYIVDKSDHINDIGKKGDFTARGEREMIVAALRKEDGSFPEYVLTGWRSVLKEFRRILTAYDTKNTVKLDIWPYQRDEDLT